MNCEFEVGGLAIRNDGIGPTMAIDDVFTEAGQVWLSFECDGGRTTWPASLFLPVAA
jgi:hypothetical protein